MTSQALHYSRSSKLRKNDRDGIKRQIRKENQLWHHRAYSEHISVGDVYGVFLEMHLHLRGDSQPVAKIVLAQPEFGYAGEFRKINTKTVYKGWEIPLVGEFAHSVKSRVEKPVY